MTRTILAYSPTARRTRRPTSSCAISSSTLPGRAFRLRQTRSSSIMSSQIAAATAVSQCKSIKVTVHMRIYSSSPFFCWISIFEFRGDEVEFNFNFLQTRARTSHRQSREYRHCFQHGACQTRHCAAQHRRHSGRVDQCHW